MNEGRFVKPSAEGNKPLYDREVLAQDLADAVAIHGGEYAENLKIDPAGRVVYHTRNGDRAPAYLPSLLAREGKGPSIEEFYRALRDIGEALPGYEVLINEDRTAGILEYRIKRKT